jgi:hypothetical protein
VIERLTKKAECCPPGKGFPKVHTLSVQETLRQLALNYSSLLYKLVKGRFGTQARGCHFFVNLAFISFSFDWEPEYEAYL